MRARRHAGAVGRPRTHTGAEPPRLDDGYGPFPTVLLLHGTHGFAREYVQWARELADAGFTAVAACWFSGGGGTHASFFTNATQHATELKDMILFLRARLAP